MYTTGYKNPERVKVMSDYLTCRMKGLNRNNYSANFLKLKHGCRIYENEAIMRTKIYNNIWSIRLRTM
jgi:hypothetical protein